MGSFIKPGIYPAFDAASYHADPCPTPSLSASIAKILAGPPGLKKTPAHAVLKHPRLNPRKRVGDEKANEDRDMGSAFHSLFLQSGPEVHVHLADDWMRKADREERDGLRAEGKIVLLGHQMERVNAMIEAAGPQLVDRGYGQAFDFGSPETCLIVSEGPDWFRRLVDWYTPRRIWDYKTTGNSADEETLARKVFTDGWPIDAAMTDWMLDRLDPETAGRREYLYVVQENYEPYALNVVRITESAMTWGRARLTRARQMWSECMMRGTWSAYPPEVLAPSPPAWLMTGEDVL